MFLIKHFSMAVVAALVALSSHAAAGERQALRVCADPNYPPFSTRERTGLENRLADILAADLNLTVEYTWFPARMGFIRNTLRAEDPSGEGYKCDVVLNVPHNYELTITTRPYYTSTYALVYVKGRGLDDVRRGEDLVTLEEGRRSKLKIGLNERDPGTLWLAKHDMFEQMVTYIAQPGDPAEYPGKSAAEDLLAGKIDAAILWGPIAAHVQRRATDVEVELIPLFSEPDVRFHFAIAVGVRHPDDEWRDQLDAVLKRQANRIQALLQEYRVPLVTDDGTRLLKESRYN